MISFRQIQQQQNPSNFSKQKIGQLHSDSNIKYNFQNKQQQLQNTDNIKFFKKNQNEQNFTLKQLQNHNNNIESNQDDNSDTEEEGDSENSSFQSNQKEQQIIHAKVYLNNILNIDYFIPRINIKQSKNKDNNKQSNQQKFQKQFGISINQSLLQNLIQVKNNYKTLEPLKQSLFIVLESQKNQKIQSNQNLKQFKTSLLASISHELKTPLNSATIMTHILNSSPQIPKQIQETYVYPAYCAIELLNSTVSDITSLAQLEIGEYQIDISQFDLKELIQQTILLFVPQSLLKNIAINADFTHIFQQNSTIFSDLVRIKQILINLLTNAFKYTQKGKITVEVNYYQKIDVIKVSVIDTGCGISNHIINKLYKNKDDFTTMKKTDFQTRGIGIGLSFCQKILQKINKKFHKLSIKSTQQKGSIISFYIENHRKPGYVQYKNINIFSDNFIDNWIIDKTDIQINSQINDYSKCQSNNSLNYYQSQQFTERNCNTSDRKKNSNEYTLNQNRIRVGSNSTVFTVQKRNSKTNNYINQDQVITNNQIPVGYFQRYITINSNQGDDMTIHSFQNKLMPQFQDQQQHFWEDVVNTSNISYYDDNFQIKDKDKQMEQVSYCSLEENNIQCNSIYPQITVQNNQQQFCNFQDIENYQNFNHFKQQNPQIKSIMRNINKNKSKSINYSDKIVKPKIQVKEIKRTISLQQNSLGNKIAQLEQHNNLLSIQMQRRKSALKIKSSENIQNLKEEKRVSLKTNQSQNLFNRISTKFSKFPSNNNISPLISNSSQTQQKSNTNCIQQCECPQILIVDDDQFNLHSVKMILQSRFKLKSDQAFNGKESVDKVQYKYENKQNKCCKHYRLIIMDIDMPIMNGIQASININSYYQQIQQQSNKPIICQHTAFKDVETFRKLKEQGILQINLNKPFSMTDIDKVINEIQNKIAKEQYQNQLFNKKKI